MEERERQLRAQKEAERLRHIREMKTREEQRLRAAEERRRALERAAEVCILVFGLESYTDCAICLLAGEKGSDIGQIQ